MEEPVPRTTSGRKINELGKGLKEGRGQRCEDCGGRGYVAVGGTAELVDCAVCRGDGAAWNTCNRCKGSGVFTNGSVKRTCMVCGGTGKFYLKVREHNKGSLTREIQGRVIEVSYCQACKGARQVYKSSAGDTTYYECGTCDGCGEF